MDQELLARSEYLATENRILKDQLKGRLMLSDAERTTLGEIGHRLGRKVLAEVATVARPDTIRAWYRKLVAGLIVKDLFRDICATAAARNRRPSQAGHRQTGHRRPRSSRLAPAGPWTGLRFKVARRAGNRGCADPLRRRAGWTETDSGRAIRWLIALMVLCCGPFAIHAKGRGFGAVNHFLKPHLVLCHE
jgi:hypothetical protein